MHEVHLLAILRLLGLLLILAIGVLWLTRRPNTPSRDTLSRVGLIGVVIEMGAMALDMHHWQALVVQGVQLLFFAAMMALAVKMPSNKKEKE